MRRNSFQGIANGALARHDDAMETALSGLLRTLRRRAGLSQLALATQAGTTQRHLSFIECGRSTPGRALLGRLADALSLNMEARNQLFCEAGFLPPVPTALREAVYEPLRQAAWHLMEQHGFYPALLLDGHFNILGSNIAFQRLLEQIDPQARPWALAGQPQPNLLQWTFHPDGLVRYMVNASSWLPTVWHQAVQQMPDDPAAQELLAVLRGYPSVQAILRAPSQPSADPMVVERYRIGPQHLALLSMMARVGAPLDRTAASLQLSLMFPADKASDDFLLHLDQPSQGDRVRLAQGLDRRRAANATHR